MIKDSKVSIIMSVYNGDRYIKNTVDSILNQTYSNYEFIIINDGSTDKTVDILKKYTDPRIHLVNQYNAGIIQSLNKAISLASGKYIARQDADDISLPDRIKEQVHVMDMDSNMVLLGSSFYNINEDGDIIGVVNVPRTDTEIRWRMIFENSFCHTSVMFRSKTIKKYNLLYNKKDLHAEDYGLWSKLIQHGSCYNIKKPLVQYRIHQNQISSMFSEVQDHTAFVVSNMNIERLGIKVNNFELIKKMKCWQYNFPKNLNEDDMEICKLYIKLIEKFSKDVFVNVEEFSTIRNALYYRICNSISNYSIKELYNNKILAELFKASKKYFLKHLCVKLLN